MAERRALMDRSRRWLAVLLLAMLTAPALGMLVAPYEERSVAERRMLEPPPRAPRRAADWLGLPRALDAWFSDHFAWRGEMARAGLTLQAATGVRPVGGVEVVKGEGDWLLLSNGLLQATGGETDPAAARRYGAFVCDLERTVEARGAGFLFAPAPGPAEIYPEAAPAWIPRGSPTQPDLVLRAARACGARPLDLRPALRAAKGRWRLYQHHDSHWTDAGALVAFDGMARALGQPWGVEPERVGLRPGPPRDSDLVRLAGALDMPPERAPELPAAERAGAPRQTLKGLEHGIYPEPFIAPPGGPRPVVLVIGDSYTADYFGPFFRRAGVTFAWTHQDTCRFDRRVLDRVKPDFVVLMPASRLAFCR